MKNSSFVFFGSGVFLGMAGVGSHIDMQFLFALVPTILFIGVGMAVAVSEES